MRNNYWKWRAFTKKFGPLLNFKYKWISRLSEILLIIAIFSGVLWIVLANFGYMLFKSVAFLLFITIFLNIIWQMFLKIGILTLGCYWLWHVILQVYKGVVKTVSIVLMSCLTFLLLYNIPNMYNSEIGHLINTRSSESEFSKDTKYLVKLTSSADRTETERMTLNSKFTNNNYFNLYFFLDVSDTLSNNNYVILSYDDAKSIQNKLKQSGSSKVSFTYNVDTKIVTDYKLVEASEDNDESDDNAKTPEKVEIWLEKKDKGVILVHRQETTDHDEKLYWYITKDGEFSECFQVDDRVDWTNKLSFVKKGEYTITLVKDYDVLTGEYMPVSNTIEYSR